MYRLVVLPSKCIAFLDVFVVVATAPYFDLKGHMEVSWHGKIQNVFVYSETTGYYYENDPVLLRVACVADTLNLLYRESAN